MKLDHIAQDGLSRLTAGGALAVGIIALLVAVASQFN